MLRLELLRLIVGNSQYFVGWVPELVLLFLLRDQRFVTKCDRGTERGAQFYTEVACRLLYTGCCDVTESMATIQSPFSGYDMA